MKGNHETTDNITMKKHKTTTNVITLRFSTPASTKWIMNAKQNKVVRIRYIVADALTKRYRIVFIFTCANQLNNDSIHHLTLIQTTATNLLSDRSQIVVVLPKPFV